ncbi:ABC transporter ATP-binding protein [Actinomadura xylanilytica]|uniref:ABC transporter ATP-binding protein n=1 Tax=Actinomadura xylanilytica TaxID=887459 RepID=UPI00255B3137|nr:ABC transporter ATP-binding protein [Actinomadura xylanilytica]MDL4777420.1 ABC transporter ATP-binding protein [Actinomadura xylanilytica]
MGVLRDRFSRPRKPRAPDTAPVPGPELTRPRWYGRNAELAETGVGTMARRLPALIAHALRLAWRANRRDTMAAVGLNLTAGLCTAFGLLATTGVLTALFTGGPTPDRVRAAVPSLAMVAAAVAAKAGLTAAAGWAQARLRPQVERLVEVRLYELTTAVELTALDDSAFLDELQRAESRGMTAAPSMVDHMVDMLTAAVGVAAAAGALGVLHPVLLPLLLLTALPEGWAAIRAARLGYLTELTLVSARRRKWILSDLMTDRHHAAEVRSAGVRGVLLGQFGRLAGHVRAAQLDLARRQTLAQVHGAALKGAATAMVYVALGLLLWRGLMPLAVAGTAVLAIRAGQSSLVNLIYAVNRCYEDGLYFGDYLAFCTRAEARLRQPGGGAHPAPPGDFEEITADGVTFTYPGGGAPALRGVSMRIRAGEIVALVGENGSGKTTLAKILAGLYTPDDGEVRWDQVPVGRADPDLLRAHIAVIAQDHTHWPMTARDNIALGDESPRDDLQHAVETAATASGADQVVDGLADRYDTLLDRRFEGGVELSGGQWQRLAAARGFYRRAPLLICDEPTAALDARAEHALFERIRGHAHGRTVLLITHRLASVRHADRIYVFDRGHITEHGDHSTLMGVNGLYAELYTLQASAYQPPAEPM